MKSDVHWVKEILGNPSKLASGRQGFPEAQAGKILIFPYRADTS